ncbi:MAG: hypothetical protein NC348_13895 [Clostridium sp.]|nr:hypothetical protein [Clostridium sp.]
MLIGYAIGGPGVMIMLIFWMMLTGGIYRFAMYYAGYMLKAGHIAVIAKTVTTGEVPENQFEYGKQMVVSYMEVAPSTEITYDLYDKLCKLSDKFKKLFHKAKEDGPIEAQPVI